MLQELLRRRARQAERKAQQADERQEARAEGRAIAAGTRPSPDDAPHPFQAITPEIVAEAWLKVIVKKALRARREY